MQEHRSNASSRGYRLSPGWLTFLVGLVMLLIAGVLYQQSLIASGGAGVSPVTAGTAAPAIKYVCPMRCVEADAPGKCPVCGMDMSPIEIGGTGATAGSDSFTGDGAH